MVSLQPPGQDTNGLQAVIYVPPADGKFVTPEMDVQLSPFAAPREEFGFLLGKVQYVSEFPSTQAGMVNTLGNSVLVQTLMSQGAPFAVYASLIVDDRPDNVEAARALGMAGLVFTGADVLRADLRGLGLPV